MKKEFICFIISKYTKNNGKTPDGYRLLCICKNLEDAEDIINAFGHQRSALSW